MSERILVNEIYPILSKNIVNNMNDIKMINSKFMQKNNDILTMVGPMKNMLFTDSIKNEMMEAFGLTNQIVKDAMLRSKDIINEAQVINPFNISCALALKFGIENRKNDLINNVLFLLTMSFYPSVYTKYYKYDPNKTVMEYVVANLSNKYKLKQIGFLNYLIEMGKTCLENHRTNLVKGDDKSFVKLINDIKSRLNQFMKNIRNEFDIAYKNNKAILTFTTDFSGEEYKVADNVSFTISNCTQNTLQALIMRSDASTLYVKYAANIVNFSVNELRNILWRMTTEGKLMKELEQVIENILIYYLQEKGMRPDTIRSNNFLTYSLELYKMRTVQQNKIIMKNLDIIMKELDIYKNYPKPNAQLIIRKAIYIFIVMTISASYKV